MVSLQSRFYCFLISKLLKYHNTALCLVYGEASPPKMVGRVPAHSFGIFRLCLFASCITSESVSCTMFSCHGFDSFEEAGNPCFLAISDMLG